MITLSLMLTSPSAESKINLPATVSIVLSLVCAILILPNSTAPPLNTPDTVKLPPI